jgi:hypothetical protein
LTISVTTMQADPARSERSHRPHASVIVSRERRAGPDRPAGVAPAAGVVRVGQGEPGRGPVGGLLAQVAQHAGGRGLGEVEVGDVDDDRLGLPGEDVEKRRPHLGRGVPTEHPGQSDQRKCLIVGDPVPYLAGHDRSIVHNASPVRISESESRGLAFSRRCLR